MSSMTPRRRQTFELGEQCQQAVDFSANRLSIAQKPVNGIYIVQYSMVDRDIALAFEDENFRSYVQVNSNLRNYEDQWENSYSNSYSVEDDDRTIKSSNVTERNQWKDVDCGTVDGVYGEHTG